MTRRRYLVLHLPLLATDRIRRRESALAGRAIATWATSGNRRVLTGVDAPGTALGPGQALADAQPCIPTWCCIPPTRRADRAFLERLALRAMRFTPIVACDPPDGLVLDVTGCAELWGGEAALLARVGRGFEDIGIAARAAVAGIADAAAALARAGGHARVVPSGGEMAAVAALPLDVLRLPGDCLAGLHRLGLREIGQVARQPRAPLMRRFGRTLLDVLDALTGDRPRALPPVRPPAVFMQAVDFLEPIVTRPAIDHALDMLLAPLCRMLGEAGQGAREVTLRAFRVDRDVQEITIGTGVPTRVPAHLRRLFDTELERFWPDLGFERMTLEVGVANDMAPAQATMPTAGRHVVGDTAQRDAAQRDASQAGPSQADAGQAEALAQLIDRLAQRLPVWRLAPGESHWPERSVVRVGPFDAIPSAAHRSDLSAAVRLLNRPVPMKVVSRTPDGPPTLLCLDGAVHAVAWSDGPERIEREWWHDAAERAGRDYYRVELASGARLWIARVGGSRADWNGRWFLHGYLA